MTRAIDAAVIAELQSDITRQRYFAELEFDGGTERLWTGLGDITANAVIWSGVGSLASIDDLEEGVELTPYSLKLGLSRLDSSLSNLAISEDYHNRPLRLYLSAVDAAGDLVAPPYNSILFSGDMVDVKATVGNADGEIILLEAESELARLDRSANVRYTDIQLQSEYSGDLALEYLTQIADHRPVWRGKNQTPLGGAGGTAGGGNPRQRGPQNRYQ